MRKRENPIKTRKVDYSGNNSGFHPVDTKVLVLPDEIEDTSEGGIVLTSSVVDQHELSVTQGYLVDWGGEAFSDWRDAHNIKKGDRVVWAVYAGQMIPGDDGKMYRLMNDTDLAAIRRD